jgi:hypothetical protein
VASILLKAGSNQSGDSNGDCGDYKNKNPRSSKMKNRGISFKSVPPTSAVAVEHTANSLLLFKVVPLGKHHPAKTDV